MGNPKEATRRMRRTLHIVIAVSLLFLSWLQLAHELDIHAHQPGHACEFCLFTGYLGHGASATIATPALAHVQYTFELGRYRAPMVRWPFHLAQSPRGPPRRSHA